jgi:hypothetical protein
MKLKLLLLIVFSLGFQISSWAQCAMCRASVENNVSNGETTIGAGLNNGILYLFVIIGAGLNNGILYLFVMPYLMAAIIGFFWYRTAKKRKAKLTLR